MAGLDLKVKLIFSVKGVERVGWRSDSTLLPRSPWLRPHVQPGFLAGAEDPASEDTEDTLPMADPLTVK